MSDCSNHVFGETAAVGSKGELAEGHQSSGG